MTISPKDFLLPPPLTGVQGERGVHWRYREDSGVAWLTLDKRGASTNTFDREVFEELGGLLTRAEATQPKAAVFRSAKPSGFAAGVDLRIFREIRTVEKARREASEAHALIDRIASLPMVTIAVVHGHCVGAGLDLVLACDRIIARSDALLGFPEVRVGLHPGLGGTARLTRRISPVEAMKMMLTGKPVEASKALALGLVDAVCEERHVANAVRKTVRGEVRRRGGGARVSAMNLGVARSPIANRLESETRKRVSRAHYPAPFALIDLWREHGGSERDMRAAEIESFANLLPTDTAQNLVRVFFLRERLKSFGRMRARRINRVHIVGAGTMGAEIGAWCALKGKHVTIADPDREALGRAVRSAAELFDKRLGGPARRAAFDRFMPDTRQSGMLRADLVIEAVPEKIELKQEVYRECEARMRENALLATNTSSLPLDELSRSLRAPGRFFGLHFFNPVSRLELVEVVRHEGTADESLATARAFVTSIRRLPAPVRSAPGFLVNRALTPYLMEALMLIDEGRAPETIDRVAEEFGMPMGPVEVADRVGLDICLQVATALRESIDRPMPEIPGWFRKKVEAGDLGVKAGRGLYTYRDGKPQKSAIHESYEATMRDRLILPMIDACVGCLAEHVVDDEETVDGAMIFATGFAPFRGGPLAYVRRRGYAEVRNALADLAQKYGDRFRPHEGWSRFITGGEERRRISPS